MNSRLHDNELSISIGLVRSLVDNQFPQYVDLPLHKLSASGSSNVLFRLGNELLVRLPRQPGGSSGIRREHRWLSEIGRHLPVAVPEIIALGKPALGFPEQWSIVSWLDGDIPEANDPSEVIGSTRLDMAAQLADVVLALRAIEVPEVTRSVGLRHYRGHALQEFDEHMQNNIQQCRLIGNLNLDLDAALEVWMNALRLPGASEAGPDRWYHSDLVAENLLLNNGQLTGVLDFGGLGIGDPTIDLHGAWELFDPPEREVFRSQLGVDDAEWLRGRAWALAIALGTFSYYWNKMPGRMRDRLMMARSVLADAADPTLSTP